MSNLLIGGSGFIGSALGDVLAAAGQPVVSVSRSNSGPRHGIEQLSLDLHNEAIPAGLLKNTSDAYLLLGQIGPTFDSAKELTSLKKITQVLAQHHHCHVFFFSSALVYGNTIKPATEATPPHPIGSYPSYKLAAEQQLSDALSSEQLTILRLGNVYGGPKNRGFINLILRSILEPTEKPITLSNNGETIRDYIFLDDLIKIVMTIKNHRARHGTINLVSGSSHSLNEIVSTVEEVTRRHLDVIRSNERLVEAQVVRTTNQLLRDRYGMTSFTTLVDGLRQTLRRYQEEMQ